MGTEFEIKINLYQITIKKAPSCLKIDHSEAETLIPPRNTILSSIITM